MHRLRRVHVAVVSTTILVALAAVTVAAGAIPDSSGIVNACYGSSGKLRAVDSAADCSGPETHLALGGPTLGYSFSNAGFAAIGETTTVVGSLELPAGSYVVHGKVDLLGSSSTDESSVVCNLTIGGTPGFSDASWNTLEPGVAGRLPSESVALQTSLVLPTAGSIVMTCVRPDGGAGAIARYRRLDAVRLDGLTTTS
jgi:hypothetical protein